MKVKIINVKIPLVGMKVPKQYGGNVGQFVEDYLELNERVAIFRGRGTDIPKYNLEIKTRKEGSSAAHTVGSITVEELMCTPYAETHLREKMLRQWRIMYNDETNVITSSEIVDFDILFVQKWLEEAYESHRRYLRSKYIPRDHIDFTEEKVIGDTGNVHFEYKYGRTYALRIGDSTMSKFLHAVKHPNKFDDVFECLYTDIDSRKSAFAKGIRRRSVNNAHNNFRNLFEETAES